MTNIQGSPLFGRAIDVHGHLVPQQLLGETDERRQGIGVEVEKSPEGAIFLRHGDDRLGPIHPGMSVASKRLEWMDARGIYRQWVSAWMDLYTWTSFDEEQTRIWYDLVNSAIFDSAQSSNGRLRPLATIYLADPGQAAAEVERRLDENHLAGLMLNTHPPECDSLASESMWPFWEVIDRIGVPVMLHPPTNGPSCQITPKLLQNITGRLIDTTAVATEMLLSGFFSRFRNTKIILVHGGGMLPYQVFRMDGLNRAGLAPQTMGGRHFIDEIRNFFYDTVTLDPASLELLVRRVGSAKVLLGSDAPFPIGDADPLGRVLAAELDSSVHEDICCNNAAQLDISRDPGHG
ncbi:MAG: amidohydrolase [Actinomycetota bacterium]|nr:MAG: amidohydrolase [Actinomycetota bacterium]